MSFIVAIVHSSVSDNDQIAWNQLSELVQAAGQPANSLTELIVELTKKYPCICDLSDDEVDSGVWSDGPLMNDVKSKAAVIGIVYSKVYEVLPFVIKTADKLGLTVFDFQNQTIHKPSAFLNGNSGLAAK
jgi:hypothetical protein